MNSSEEPTSSARRTAALLAVCLFLAEIAKHAALLTCGAAQPCGDSPAYWRLAGRVADGDVWLMGVDVGSRTPGYPWWLAVCRVVGGQGALACAVLLQHVCVLATSLLTAWWTARVTGSARAGLVAWAWCALSTARPLYANWLLTETLAALALTAVCVLLDVAWRGGRLRWLTAAAAVGVAGILVRPSLVVVVPLVLIVSGARVWRRTEATWLRRGTELALPLLVVAAGLAPWCLRNQALYQRCTLLTFTGRELWTATFSPWPGAGLDVPADGAGADLRARISTAADVVDWRNNWSVSRALSAAGLNDAEVDALMERVARQAIGRAPGRALLHGGARCATFWYVKEWPPPEPPAEPDADLAGQRDWRCERCAGCVASALAWTPERWFPSMWLWSALTWIGVLVLVRTPATRPTGCLIGGAALLTTALTAALEIPMYRYRLPLEPLMIVAVTASARLARQALCSGRRAGEGS